MMPDAAPSGRPVTQRADRYKLEHIRPFQAGEYRPNNDGSYSTELTVTVPAGQGEWVNVPSLWMSPGGWVELSEDEAAQAAALYEKRMGAAFPRFKALSDAETTSAARSHAGGVSNGSLAMPMKTRMGGLGGLGGMPE